MITGAGCPGSHREGEESGEQVVLIITSIYLCRTPAPIHDGASQRGCTFDESPLKKEPATGGWRARVSAGSLIHHLIRTLAWVARDDENRMLSLFRNASNIGFFGGGGRGGVKCSLFNSQGQLMI